MSDCVCGPIHPSLSFTYLVSTMPEDLGRYSPLLRAWAILYVMHIEVRKDHISVGILWQLLTQLYCDRNCNSIQTAF